MLLFALHVKTDRKPTVVNKITRNLFLQRPEGIDCQISKEKNSDNNKTNNAIYWCKPKLLSCQPTSTQYTNQIQDRQITSKSYISHIVP